MKTTLHRLADQMATFSFMVFAATVGLGILLTHAAVHPDAITADGALIVAASVGLVAGIAAHQGLQWLVQTAGW